MPPIKSPKWLFQGRERERERERAYSQSRSFLCILISFLIRFVVGWIINEQSTHGEHALLYKPFIIPSNMILNFDIVFPCRICESKA